MNALDVRGVSKSYGPILALENVSFSVRPGEIVGLLGPNGAGKTTLMKVLTGYLQADEGQALVDGIDVGTSPLQVQARIGYLPENAPLYRDMTVGEYLLLMADLRSLADSERRPLLSRAVEATGLEGYLDRRIDKLSKGYRQRVGIAQAILHRPRILILDEPTSGLDPTQIAEIRQLIQDLSADATVMISTHILSEVEMTCERVVMIMNGALRADANLEELRAASAAVVAVDAKVAQAEVEEALRGVDGVAEVQAAGEHGGFRRYRVTGEKDEPDLCPAVFDCLRRKSWRVAELRSDSRSLETVFRELAESPDKAVLSIGDGRRPEGSEEQAAGAVRSDEGDKMKEASA